MSMRTASRLAVICLALLALLGTQAVVQAAAATIPDPYNLNLGVATHNTLLIDWIREQGGESERVEISSHGDLGNGVQLRSALEEGEVHPARPSRAGHSVLLCSDYSTGPWASCDGSRVGVE